MRVCMCVWVRVLRGRVRVAQGRIQGLGPVVLCSLEEGEMGEGAVLTRSIGLESGSISLWFSSPFSCNPEVSRLRDRE